VGPKVCAGAISIKCKDLGIPDNLFERSFHSIIVSTPYQKRVLKYNKNMGYTIDRAVLGAYMEKKAKTRRNNQNWLQSHFNNKRPRYLLRQKNKI